MLPERQRAADLRGDFGQQISEQGGQPPRSGAKIGAREDNAGAHDADPDLADAGNGESEGFAIHAAGRAELIAGDDRGRLTGQRRRVGREIAQQRGDKCASCAPKRESLKERGAILGNHAVNSTIAKAPTKVPIMRNHPFRSDVPRCGRHTSAAEVPAQ